MALDARLHVKLFAAITVLPVARSMAIRASDSRRRMNPMMKHDMVRQMAPVRPGLFRPIRLHFFFGKFIVHREPMTIHTIRHRRHIGIRRGPSPCMASGAVQAYRIAVNGVVKRKRGHSPFGYRRFPHQKIGEEQRRYNRKKDDRPTERPPFQKPRHFNARKPHITKNRNPLKGD